MPSPPVATRVLEEISPAHFRPGFPLAPFIPQGLITIGTGEVNALVWGSDGYIAWYDPATEIERKTVTEVFVETITSSIEEPDSWARGDNAYSLLLDPSKTPERALSWLGQFVGVSFTGARDRSLISQRSGWRRGRIDYIKEVAQYRLTGDKFVNIQERLQNDPYKIGISVRASETPNPDATRMDIESVIPAGIILTLNITGVAITWEQLKAKYTDWDEVDDLFADWDNVRLNILKGG